MARKKKARPEDSNMTATAATGPRQLRIAGEMTIYTAADLKGQIVTALNEADALEIDLSEVSEIDTSGLQLLLLVKREAAQHGKSATLVGHSHAVIECLDMCNVTAMLGDQVVMAAG
jgi:anti-sigma B factor antagonist